MYSVPSTSATSADSRKDLLRHIDPAHADEWVIGSGVSAGIMTLCIKSLCDHEAIATRIGWKEYPTHFPLGWFVSGLDLKTMQPSPFGQFKPNHEIQLPGNKKPSKYLTDKGRPYDAIALPHPDKDFWRRVVDDSTIPVDIDEGAKKSGAGITCGFPSLSLCGVTMWQREGELVNNLAVLAVTGRHFRIRFDMDVLTKKQVRHEVEKLAKALIARGCTVSVAMWNPDELGLKIDDVKVKHGNGAVIKIMDEALPYSQWLKNLESQINSIAESPVSSGSDVPAKNSKKPPTPRETAAKIAEQYGHQWKYDDEQKTWRVYSSKHWEKIGLGAFKSLVKTTLDAKGVIYSGMVFINDVVELLQCDLRQIRWQMWDRKRYTNFNNCVLDGDSLATQQHSPGMGFTSFLPYEYKTPEGDLSDPLEALRVNCPSTHKFFRTAMQGDERKMFKLLAVANAILKHRFHDLQMFVHLVGKPGSGKGTYARLMEKLVGRENFKGCQLDRLTDGSTRASVVDKQLVVFADERKPSGIDSILSFTGGDAVSYRELHTPAADAFFYGCFLICSNKPIFVGDTTGLERRLCLIHFDNPIPTEKRNHGIESEFDAEIPALIGIALSIANSDCNGAIRGIGAERIVEFKHKEWEMRVETDSIAAFFDMELVADPSATTRTGKLFEAYTTFCDEGGMSRIKIVKFGGILADILTDENIPFVRKQGAQAYFEGIRLRKKSDQHPTHSESLTGVEGVGGRVLGSLEGVAEGVEPLPDVRLRELREFCSKPSNSFKKYSDLVAEEEESDQETALEENLPPLTPSTPSNVVPAREVTPSATPSKLPSTPPQTLSIPTKSDMQTTANRQRAKRMSDEYREAKAIGDTEKTEKIRKFIESTDGLPLRGFFKLALDGVSPAPPPPKQPHIFEVGDRVVAVDVGGQYHGVTGVVVEIRSYPTRTGLMVKFDKEVAFSQQREFIAGDLMYLPEK